MIPWLPEVFSRARRKEILCSGHDRHRKLRKKNLWHPGYNRERSDSELTAALPPENVTFHPSVAKPITERKNKRFIILKQFFGVISLKPLLQETISTNEILQGQHDEEAKSGILTQ